MKGWRKRVLFGALAGLLVVAIFIPVWLFHAPFFSGTSPPTTQVAALLKDDNPQQMLAAANRLSWLLNWPKAGPLYQRAQILFSKEGDARDALYAQVGYIRSQAETMPFVDISNFLAAQLQTPLVRQHPRLRLWCLISKGNTDIEIDIAAAQQDWEDARTLARQLHENGWANRATGELGLLAFLEGNPKRASDLVAKAFFTARATGDVGGEIRYLELLGDGFKELNRQEEALFFFNHAIDLARSTPDVGFPFMAYEGKARSLVALHRAAEAEALLQSSLREAKSESKFGHAAQIEVLLGELALKTGDRDRAAGYFEEASKVSVRRRYYRMASETLFDLATIYRDEGRLPEAENCMVEGVDASRRVGDRYYLPRNLQALAELKAQAVHVAQAHALYEQAEDVVDGMLAHSPGPYTESSLLSAMSSIYLGDFALAAGAHETATAFAIIERARGRTAADMLRNHSVKGPETPAERTLESQMSTLQVQLMRSDDPKARTKLLDSLLEAEEKLGYNEGSLRPALHLISTERVPLPQFQGILRPDEALLEYVLTEPHGFCLAVTHKEASVFQLPAGRKQIETLVSDYLSNVKTQKRVAQIERTLYSLLVAPIPKAFRAPRLIVVPDGGLNRLPYETLRNANGQSLIRSHVVFYAPSATTLYFLRTLHRATIPQLAFLGVGDVRYQPPSLLASNTVAGHALSSIERGLDDLAGVHLSNLPATRQEVIDASRALGQPGSVLLLGTGATETAFKREPLSNFKIIHFAVHAISTPHFPERSALILGRAPHSKDDGLLQAREIATLTLNADLVTLSACDTAKGKLEGEEGDNSLVQAFLMAGAKSVVAALWKVDDDSTADLMKQFYTHFALGEDKAAALRDAKLDVLNQLGKRSPVYWAGFILTGDGSKPITLSK
jgi:CHAT domain-containing protein